MRRVLCALLCALFVVLFSVPAPAADWLIDSSPYVAQVIPHTDAHEIALTNGLIRRTFRIAPNAATIAFDHLVTNQSLLRGVKPEARVTIDGVTYDVGGLQGQPNYAFLLPAWTDTLSADPKALSFCGYEIGEAKARMDWAQVRHHAPDAMWPPKGASLRLFFEIPDGAGPEKLWITVHYEIYDGIPVLCKWITVENRGTTTFTLNSFTSEIVAAVENASAVEELDVDARPNIHVETDYAFSGDTAEGANRHAVHWMADPEYQTQVHYRRQTPCLLEVRPEMGPEQQLDPGETFTSFRTFILPFEDDDRERNGLALRRMYRTLAPWTTENPLMLHARFADWEQVKTAIDQCAEVGFEMVILTFGSGFNIEDDSAEYMAKMTQYADYAREKGVEIGGYSLLASRSIDTANDVVMPEGQSPTFGHSPCIGSPWGQEYFQKLYAFYEKTGFMLLEHDGSYPGDVCRSTEHPGHVGLADSRWNQYKTISEFYQWCRGRGISLNVPDYYYLAGSTKSAMGYRETNWSLPRAEQIIHTRQNIYDGTWQKTPSMGWMFVPLTEYQGGGEAATVEPLDSHLDHYERIMMSNFALGVQACYRGPRLYDTDRTKAMVQKAVAWYKEYRDILESDVVHGRRADGRDLDWMLHVNPKLPQKGMLVVWNPLKEAVTRTLSPDLYYTGLSEVASIRAGEENAREFPIDRDFTVELEVTVPGEGFAWYVIE